MPRLSTILDAARRLVSLEGLRRDVTHAARVYAKSPAFTAIAVMSIAFGTGANVAVFSVADAVLLRPLPVARPGELVTVGSRIARGLAHYNVASYPDYVDIRDRSRSFDGLVAFASRRAGFRTRPDAFPYVKLVTMVSGNFFSVLGVEPHIGRGFLPDEDRVPGRNPVAVVSYGMWQQELAGDPSVLGRRILIAGIEFTIVGVAPPEFTGIEPRFARDSAYVPLAMWPKLLNSPAIDPLLARDYRQLTLKGRLEPGVTLADARTELEAIGRDLERAYPDTNLNQTISARSELEVRFERTPLDSGAVLVLTTLSLAVLCVACANVAGLLASRAPVRARELALRLAIGASRARLVRQLVTESLGIALIGGLCGLAVGYVGIVLLRQIQYPTDVIATPVMQLDRRALTFSLAVAMTSAFLFGLGPAIHTTRVDLVSALKAAEPGTASRRQRLTGRSALVTIQVALSLVLLTITIFAFQVFSRELNNGPGFRTTKMAKVTIDTGQARYGERQAAAFFARAVDNARRLPGAGLVTATSAIPLFGFELVTVVPEGLPMPEDQPNARTYANSVHESYFDTMEIPLVAGRGFNPFDTTDALRVAVVNERVALRYWPGQDAIGKRFRIAAGPERLVEIVGIAKTTTYAYPGEPVGDAVYFPFRQEPRLNMVLVAQTAGDSATLLTPLREMVHDMDADVPVYEVQTIETFYGARVTVLVSVLSRLIGGMGLMGMMLTAVGLYGLVSYSVSRRTREIGIRIAIGATSGRVLRMILRQGLTPAWIGVAVGLLLSTAATRLLPRLFPLQHGFSPRSYALVIPLLFLVALIAAFVPARRAARVNAIAALRCD